MGGFCCFRSCKLYSVCKTSNLLAYLPLAGFLPYGRVLLFSVLQIVFSLQNQQPPCIPAPCRVFAIWAGFAFFGLANHIQFAKPATSLHTCPLRGFCHMGGFYCFLFVFKIRTRWRGAARLKVAGATACVDFVEIAKAQFKINWQNLRFCHTFAGSPFVRPPQPAKVRVTCRMNSYFINK